MSSGKSRLDLLPIRVAASHLKVGLADLGAPDAVHAVVAQRRVGQSGVPLPYILAVSQGHVTDQQQPGSVCLAWFGVLQAGAVDRRHELVKVENTAQPNLFV